MSRLLKPKEIAGAPAVAGLPALAWTMVRPAAVMVVLLFAALGAAQAGSSDQVHPLFTTILLTVVAWFVNATCLNDITDESIDRVNLPGVKARPLVSGYGTPDQLLTLAAASGLVALTAGFLVDFKVGLVVTAGLGLNAAYSLPPVRLAERGGLATALLPLGYLAIPYFVAAFTISPQLSRQGLILFGGLYLSFAGRIILKDFRDVEGDARYGKRTFVLRHGTRVTCGVSAALWLAGAAAVPFVVPAGSPLLIAFPALVLTVLYGLRRLSAADLKIEQIKAIGCIALVGRGMTIALLAHYSMAAKGWPAPVQMFVVMALTAVVCGMFFAYMFEQGEATEASSS